MKLPLLSIRLGLYTLLAVWSVGAGGAPCAMAAASEAQKERFVTVTGEVSQPGRVPFSPGRGLTIADAITRAGGFTRLGDIRRVKLTRRGANGTTTESVIDVNAIMKAGGRDAPQLEDGDVVYVPRRIT